jgi:chromosome partitioning protein
MAEGRYQTLAARVIVCANQKGGVGKTTTAVHLAVGLCRAGARVSLYDLDPQRNAVLCLTETGDPPIDAGRDWLHWPGSREVDLRSPGKGSPAALEAAVADPSLDYVVIDCAPSLGAWTEHALALAHHVVIPLQCEFLAMEGLAIILQRTEGLPRHLGEAAARLHVLPVMVDLSLRIHADILHEVRAHLGGYLCTTVIPRDARFVEAASFGMSVFRYDIRSLGSMAYAVVVREVRDGWS